MRKNSVKILGFSQLVHSSNLRDLKYRCSSLLKGSTRRGKGYICYKHNIPECHEEEKECGTNYFKAYMKIFNLL